MPTIPQDSSCRSIGSNKLFVVRCTVDLSMMHGLRKRGGRLENSLEMSSVIGLS